MSFVGAAFIISQALIVPYMFANLKFNGCFTVADRGPWIIYGKAAKRAEKFTLTDLKPAVAYAVGEGICKKLYGETECLKWSPVPVDRYGHEKMDELKSKGLATKEVDRTLLKLAFEKIREHPFQYGILTAVEGFKMMFWESTRIGYVQYPGWLERLYDWGPLKDGLRLILSCLTMISLLFLSFYLYKNQKGFSRPLLQSTESFVLCSLLLFLIIYIGMYSFFFIVPRHVFAIVPLYLVVIAFFIQNFFTSNKTSP